jgi:hypothetical protein
VKLGAIPPPLLITWSAKARTLQQEKTRQSEQSGDLLACLQLADRGHILVQDPVLRELTTHESKAAGKRAFSTLDALRNDLAHAQSPIPRHWPTIRVLAEHLERTLEFDPNAIASTCESGT